jgi:hypothetical protein
LLATSEHHRIPGNELDDRTRPDPRVTYVRRRCQRAVSPAVQNSVNTFGSELSHAVYKTFAVNDRLDPKRLQKSVVCFSTASNYMGSPA